MISNIWKSVEILISRDNPWVGFNKKANNNTEGTWCQNTALLFNKMFTILYVFEGVLVCVRNETT